MSVSLSDDTLEKLESHGIDFDEIDLDDPDFLIGDFFEAVDAIDDPEVRRKAYIVFFTDDDYYGFYTKSDKPPLLKEELDLDDEEIVAVSDNWLARNGEEFSLWWDLRIIETADGERYLIHEGITPELYEQSEKALQDGGVGNGQPDYVDEVPEEVMKWFLRMEDAGYEVYGPDSGIILPSSMSDVGMTTATSHREDGNTPIFGFKIEVNDPYSKMYDIEGDVITVETADGEKYVISKEYTPHAFAAMKNLGEVMGDLRDQVRDGDLILLQRDDDTPVLSADDEIEYIRDENGHLIDGGLIVHRKNGDTYLVMEGITPEQYGSISGYQSARNRSEVDDIFRGYGLPIGSDTNIMQVETEDEDTVGDQYLQNLEDLQEALENGEIHFFHLKNYNYEFYTENYEAINTLIGNWDEWSSRGRLSTDDLESLLDNDDLTSGERAAVEFFLEDDAGKGFFKLLDTLYQGGNADGVISKHDLTAWLQLIRVEPAPLDGKIFDREEDYEDIELDGDELLVDEEAAEKLEKFIFLITIQTQLIDGTFEFLPYQTLEDLTQATSNRASETALMSLVDFRGLVDEHALGQLISEMMQDDTIAALTRDSMVDARSKIKDIDGLIDTLYESLTGDGATEYVKALDDLKELGLEAEGQARLERDLDALELLDPEKAAEAREQILAASYGKEIDDIMELMDAEYESGEYSDETLDAAEAVANDLAMTFITGFILTNFLTHVGGANAKLAKIFLDGVRNGFSDLDLSNLNSADRQLMGQMIVAHDAIKNIIHDEVLKGSSAGEITSEEINKNIQKTIDNVSDKYGIKINQNSFDKIQSGFQSLLDSRALSAIGGIGALSAVVYRMHGDNSRWTDQTAEERAAQTRSFLVFLGSTPYAIQALDHMFGKDANWTSALGLDKQLADVFAENHPDWKMDIDADANIAQQYNTLKTEFGEKIAELKEIGEKIEKGTATDEDKARAQTLLTELNSDQQDMRRLIEDDTRLTDDQKQTMLADNDDVGNRLENISDSGVVDPNSVNEINYLDDKRVVEGVTDSIFSSYHEKANELDRLALLVDNGELELNDGTRQQMNTLLDGMRDDIATLNELVDKAPEGVMSEKTVNDIKDFTAESHEAINTIEKNIENGNTRVLYNSTGELRINGQMANIYIKGDFIASDPLELMNEQVTRDGITSTGHDGPVEMAGGPGGDDTNNVPDNNDGRAPNGSTQDVSSNKWYSKPGPLLNFLSYGTDLAGGIIDLTLSALRMDELLKGDPNDLAIAAESMFLASGAYFTISGGGAIGSALVGSQAARASSVFRVIHGVSRFAGPVGTVAGLVTGMIGLALDLILSEVKGAEKEAEIREKFEKLEEYGVADEDWGDKLNFLIHMTYEYNNMQGDMPPPPELLGFGRKFYEDNEEHFETIAENWDDWTGNDNIVSRDDLEHIAENKSNRFLPNRDFTKAEQEAAQFLLDNEDFFDFLDTLHRGGDTDGKISSADLDGWFQLMGERDVTEDNPIYGYIDEPADPIYYEIFPTDKPIWEAQPELYDAFIEDQEAGTGEGMTNWRLFSENWDLIQLNVHGEDFYEDNKEVIDDIVKYWDNWADDDGAVSKEALEERYEELAYTGPRSGGALGEEYRALEKAIEFLLEDEKSFFKLLDTFVRGGSADGVIDGEDLDGWLKIIGERENPDDEPIFKRDIKYQLPDAGSESTFQPAIR